MMECPLQRLVQRFPSASTFASEGTDCRFLREQLCSVQ